MLTGEMQKHELINELNELLEQGGAPLTRIVRKALRLANLCENREHQILFEMHLAGLNPADNLDAQINKWRNQNPELKWDVFEAFHKDRTATGDRFQALPIEILETRIEQLKKEKEAILSSGNIGGAAMLLEAELTLSEILGRIQGRVCNFIRERENDVGESEREAEIGQGGLSTASDKKIFIGHGRSSAWKDLKDFLSERLNLSWDEFNREATAGLSTKERLEEMLDKACFAFLIMTSEDEHSDLTLHARENVIHEVGLFQGRLGFKKAIVLLEDGCEEFSNIRGITQIRFPCGNILAASEEIRRTLEREKLL